MPPKVSIFAGGAEIARVTRSIDLRNQAEFELKAKKLIHDSMRQESISTFTRDKIHSTLAEGLIKTDSDLERSGESPFKEKQNSKFEAQRSISSLTNCKVSARLFQADLKELQSIVSSGENSL